MRPRLRQSTYHFNREILIGECGALVVAAVTAPVASHYTRNPAVISSSAVAGTLVGGGLSWLAARIYDQVQARTFAARTLAGDLGYFTPAAILFGLGVYDPAIYLIAHALLERGVGVTAAVAAGQVVAFGLFLLCLNLYRLALLRLRGRSL
jgi:hypothetical protein